MTEKEEGIYIQGQASVARHILGALTPYLSSETNTRIRTQITLEETRVALLEIKEEYLLDFPDDLYIPDILNKHIIPLLQDMQFQLGRNP